MAHRMGQHNRSYALDTFALEKVADLVLQELRALLPQQQFESERL